MTNANNFGELLKSLLSANGNSGNGRRGSDVRKPDEVFFVPGTNDTLQIGIYRAVHRRDGSRSLYFDPRRVKGGKKLKSMQIEQLPALILGLFTLARGAARDEEWVDATTRARLTYLADHLETVVSESAVQNGEDSKQSSFFDLAA